MRQIALTLLLSSFWSYAAAQEDKVISPRPSAKGPGLQMLGTNFRANPKWTKSVNVKAVPSCGLALKDRNKSGSMLSPVFELDGIDQIGTSWNSDTPNDRVVIKIRTAKEKNDWGDWVIVNEQPKAMPKTTVGKTVEGLSGSKYLQYLIELDGPTNASACFRAIYLIGTTKSFVDALRKKNEN